MSHVFTKMSARNRVARNLGDGALIYEGIQAKDYPQFTLWRFLVYGGLGFVRAHGTPTGQSRIICHLDHPPPFEVRAPQQQEQTEKQADSSWDLRGDGT